MTVQTGRFRRFDDWELLELETALRERLRKARGGDAKVWADQSVRMLREVRQERAERLQ